jgi:hypothetical protein
MRKADVAISVLFLAFAALLVFVIPRENPGGTWHGLSPYFYPMVMIGGITLGSIGLLVQSLTRPRLYDDQPQPMTWSELGFFLIISAIVLASVLVIHRFGTWVGGPLLIAAAMLFMGERRPTRIVPIALIAVAGVQALTVYGLKTPLP